VAAELAVNHIMQSVAKGDGKVSKHIIEQAVNEASSAIAAHSSTNDNLKGMGATCAIVWIIDNKLHTAYVGDSRIYLMRGGRIQQLTVDHSWVQEAIEKGILTPELAREHPNVHVIRRYLGSPCRPNRTSASTCSTAKARIMPRTTRASRSSPTMSCCYAPTA
jgi:PPM family protein phosphatase